MSMFAGLMRQAPTAAAKPEPQPKKAKPRAPRDHKRTREAGLPDVPNPFGLSPTQCAVCSGFAEGLSGQEIAERLCISNKTVDTHRARAAVKLDAKTTAHLAVLWDRFDRGQAS